jgi:hypothetical protein
MSFKPINKKMKPDTFKKACCIYPSNALHPITTLLTMTFATSEILTSSDEYMQALAELMLAKTPNSQTLKVDPYTTVNNAIYINSYMFMNYGNRKLYQNYFEWFDCYENSTDEINYLIGLITQDIYACSKANMYKWSNLLKSTLLEFNPLWNVDGVTGEIRETTHTGTDTNSHKGKDTNSKKGYDTNVKTGNEQLDYNGSKTNTKGGNDITTTSNTTTESSVFYDATKNDTDYGQTDTETYNNRNDKRTYNNVQDKMDYNSSNENEYNSSLERLLNLKDKDLFMQIKQGNIGVIETTTLLNHFREYVNFKVVDIIAKDLIDAITEGVY